MGVIEADLLNQMRSVRLDDPTGHTRLIMALQISSAVTRHLWHVIQDGAQAREQIQLRGSRID